MGIDLEIKKDYVKQWCENALKKTKNVNFNSYSSYGLKHQCEESIGVYVSNSEIKEVMRELGYKVDSRYGINDYYNISKLINKVVFSNKLGVEYNQECRFFNKRSETINIDFKKNVFEYNYNLVYENDEVTESFKSNIELEEGAKFSYNGFDFIVTLKSVNNILAENV